VKVSGRMEREKNGSMKIEKEIPWVEDKK